MNGEIIKIQPFGYEGKTFTVLKDSKLAKNFIDLGKLFEDIRERSNIHEKEGSALIEDVGQIIQECIDKKLISQKDIDNIDSDHVVKKKIMQMFHASKNPATLRKISSQFLTFLNNSDQYKEIQKIDSAIKEIVPKLVAMNARQENEDIQKSLTDEQKEEEYIKYDALLDKLENNNRSFNETMPNICQELSEQVVSCCDITSQEKAAFAAAQVAMADNFDCQDIDQACKKGLRDIVRMAQIKEFLPQKIEDQANHNGKFTEQYLEGQLLSLQGRAALVAAQQMVKANPNTLQNDVKDMKVSWSRKADGTISTTMKEQIKEFLPQYPQNSVNAKKAVNRNIKNFNKNNLKPAESQVESLKRRRTNSNLDQGRGGV